MANLIRSSKSGSKWTTHDLEAYNIRVSSQSPANFYGQPLPPVESLSSLDPNLLSGTLHTQGVSEETYRVLEYLDLAARRNSSQESAIDDVAKEILRALGYENHGLVLRSRYDLPLVVSGVRNRSAKTNVCLIHSSSTTLLVIQENKTIISHSNPEPQVIAEAIATFQFNNRIRAQCDKSACDSMIIPCIMMIGTRPTFYLVPVTKALSEAVATGQYPLSSTVVKECIVESNSSPGGGMETPEFRKVALQHFAAFRTLAEVHWSAFTIPVDVEMEA